MTKFRSTAILLLFLIASHMAQAQNVEAPGSTFELWIGILEIPFLFFCLFGALQVVSAFKKGIFSSGMKLIFRGLLLLALGHLVTQVNRVFELNWMSTLGQTLLILIVSAGWLLCGLGMLRLFNDSRGID